MVYYYCLRLSFSRLEAGPNFAEGNGCRPWTELLVPRARPGLAGACFRIPRSRPSALGSATQMNARATGSRPVTCVSIETCCSLPGPSIERSRPSHPMLQRAARATRALHRPCVSRFRLEDAQGSIRSADLTRNEGVWAAASSRRVCTRFQAQQCPETGAILLNCTYTARGDRGKMSTRVVGLRRTREIRVLNDHQRFQRDFQLCFELHGCSCTGSVSTSDCR